MSDNEEQYNAKAHKGLLQAISSLGKVQHVRKSTRDEPKKHQDEFQLVKGGITDAAADRPAAFPVGVNDLVQILTTTKKHIDAGKKLKKVQKAKKVLEKPLEKPAADRIKRTIGYENIKRKLGRWDAVVATNRSAETQVFPLKSETIYINTSAHAKPLQLSIKSDLALEMEATEAKLKALKRERLGDTVDEKELERRENELLKMQLTREELEAARKDIRFLKLRESQKAAKARRQNKIKSKKYHKLMKRQKVKEQIKEFELLQKSNPEAALEKLNALERSRVLERANLRHKNTGVWAKNLQVRAKYDTDVRKDLAEQLQISRQLTQKPDNDDDSAESETNEGANDVEMEDNDPFNPWMRAGRAEKGNKSGESEAGEWRKYWLERNKNEKLLEEYNKDETMAENEVSDEEDTVVEASADPVDEDNVNKPQDALPKHKLNIKVKKDKSKKPKKPTIENGWTVEDIVPAPLKNGKNIDDIFDEQEDKINHRLGLKLESLIQKGKQMNQVTKKPKNLTKKEKDALKQLNDLAFKNQAKRPIIDEELNYDESELAKGNSIDALLTKAKSIDTATAAAQVTTDTIDPNNFVSVNIKQHISSFTAGVSEAMDGDIMEEDDVENAHRMTITEAFEDDDIIADFSKDKEKDSELKNTEMQLSMPGWGSWAGPGINTDEANKNKNKLLVLKLAEKEKRRDDNRNGVYINEAASKQLRAHLVSDLPFPFTSLQDYEASVRAPLGRNYVPETAFRMLTRPAIITHKGQVIDPMDETELMKAPRKLRHVVDKRIARMSNDKHATAAPAATAK